MFKSAERDYFISHVDVTPDQAWEQPQLFSEELRARSDRCGDHLERTKGMFMKTTRIMAIAALIVTTGLALYVAQAQQVGGRRIDLQRHDLSVAGREVVQTIVELAPGTTAPGTGIRAKRSSMSSKARGNTRWRASRP